NKKDIEAHNDAFEVGDDGYLTTAAPTPSHIWIVSADGGAARRLTHGTWSLAKSQPPGPPSSPLSWSPDGKALLFTEQATPHFGDGEQTRVMVLGGARGATRALPPPRSAWSWATSARRGRSGWTRRSTGTGRSPSPAARRVGRRSCITWPRRARARAA